MRTSCSIAIVAASVVTMALSACGSSGTSDSVITLNSAACGGTWELSGPGWHTFQLRNANTVAAEVDLVDPGTGGIYAEVNDLGPGTTAPMSLDVGSGSYAFRCLFDEQEPLTGQVATLKGDVLRGDLAAARRDWLTAHLTYERLGSAYNAFGNFDDEIDERADALGLSNPRWTGFYRIEYGLWHGQGARELRPYAVLLASDVAAVLRSWPQTQISLVDLGRRAHEILENALEYQLTGHDDYGSNTTIDTTLANIAGTRELLTVLRPLLAPRYPGLPAVYADLGRLQSLLEPVLGAAIPALPARTRQAIDASCDQAVEDLAPIASITEPRNT